MTRAVLIVVVAMTCVIEVSGRQAPATAQSAPPTGLVLGRVIDADSSKPISSIVITLRDMSSFLPGAGRPMQPRTTITDAQGRFVFRGLAKGSYQIFATVGGYGFAPSGFMVTGTGQQNGPYLDGGYGQRRPGGLLQTIDFADGDRLGDVVIRMWKGAAIDGIVSDETGEALVGLSVAAVQRSSDGRLLTGPSTKTDDRGWYHLGTLTPGEYLVVVPQTQVLMPIENIDSVLASGQPAAVTASQFSANGATSPNASGKRVGVSVLSVPGGYVMNGPEPIEQSGRLFTYQTTFHPSATSTSLATVLAVRSGETRSGINIGLAPVSVAEVSGTLMDDVGPVANFGIHLLPVETGDGASVLETATTATNSRGEFVLPMVPAGRSTIVALKPPLPAASAAPGTTSAPTPTSIASRPGAYAEQAVSVGADPVRGLLLTMRAGAQVGGRIEFRGASAPPPVAQLTKMTVGLAPARPLTRAGTNATSGTIDANGAFAVIGVPPGRSVIRVAEIPPWSLQSVEIAGQDVTDRPIPIASEQFLANVSVVFTDQPAELSGTAHGASAGSDANAVVLLFPASRGAWPDARVSTRSFRASRSSRTGAFRFANVIPGDYLVVAVTDEVAANWPDQKFLNAIAPLATAVHVDANQKATVTLTMRDIK